MTESGQARAEFLARLAYRTFRQWMDPDTRSRVLFEQLSDEQRRAWTEVALTLAREIWVDSRPPIEPTPIPRKRRTGEQSAFGLLDEG